MISRRIRDNQYEFPTERTISSQAQSLIQQILTPDPQQRPTLHSIVDHPFFTRGIVPPYIPSTAHDSAPDFRYITRLASDANLLRLRRQALLDEDQITHISAPGPSLSREASLGKLKTSTMSIAQQEREFQKAVQPGSPISALLSSARQPLLMSGGGSGNKDSPLFRKLQATKEGAKRSLFGIAEDEAAERREKKEKEEADVRKKELESQKARIVAQMVPGDDDQENVPPMVARKEKGKAAVKDDTGLGRASEVDLYATTNTDHTAPPLSASQIRPSAFDAAFNTLTSAFTSLSAGKLFRDPKGDLGLPEERVFIVSWVDYCNKYGMGYALTDGSVGVHFNDSTTLVLSPDKWCVFSYASLAGSTLT
jgi:cell cycle serine/threonine-protein kinase CDC5/MSD2